MQNSNEPRIIVALDYPSAAAALALVEGLDPNRCILKVGKELFTRAGPALVEKLVDKGFKVFLDLKFHDIPNTVAAACRAAADLGVWMLNVHASGGRKMMEAATDALFTYGDERPLAVGVTILTSLNVEGLKEIGYRIEDDEKPSKLVLPLAKLAEDCGLDGVVTSPLEVPELRIQHGSDFVLVAPGVRPKGSAKGDQKRVTTPEEAIESGASYLVIGRPITAAPDPMLALASIEQSISNL